MRIWIRDREYNIDAHYYAEFARDENGDCALCKGDPCAEYSDKDSLIWKFMHNEDGSWSGEVTCPVCDGRPT